MKTWLKTCNYSNEPKYESLSKNFCGTLLGTQYVFFVRIFAQEDVFLANYFRMLIQFDKVAFQNYPYLFNIGIFSFWNRRVDASSGRPEVSEGILQRNWQTCQTWYFSNNVLQKFTAFVKVNTERPQKVLHLIVFPTVGLGFNFFFSSFLLCLVLRFPRFGSHATGKRLLLEMF